MQPPPLLDFPVPSPVTYSHMPSPSLEVTEVTMFLTPVLPFVHCAPPPDHHDSGLIFNYFLPFTILYLIDYQIIPCCFYDKTHCYFSVTSSPALSITFGPNSHSSCHTVLSSPGFSFFLHTLLE